MFGIPKWIARRSERKARNAEMAKRERLARAHDQHVMSGSSTPFSRTPAARAVTQDDGSTNLLSPASPLYAGNSAAHTTHTQHHAPDCSTGNHTSYSGGHDSGSSYSGSSDGGGSCSDGGGGGGGGGD